MLYIHCNFPLTCTIQQVHKDILHILWIRISFPDFIRYNKCDYITLATITSESSLHSSTFLASGTTWFKSYPRNIAQNRSLQSVFMLVMLCRLVWIWEAHGYAHVLASLLPVLMLFHDFAVSLHEVLKMQWLLFHRPMSIYHSSFSHRTQYKLCSWNGIPK